MRFPLRGLLAGAFSVLALAKPMPSQADGIGAESVKAGFVYNFTKFVEWPAASLPAGSPLHLCVAGAALNGKLGLLQGRQSQGHEIRVRDIAGQGDLANCHILYIAPSEARRMNGLLIAVANAPVLTISDIEEFPVYGGMIGLTLQDKRVGFAINLANARAAGLKPSAQLLRLGEVVQ